MLTLKDIKEHPQILEFIRQSELSVKALGYTEHGLRHSGLVSQRSQKIAKEVGLSERGAELAAIAGFCHDMGNFLGRSRHHYWGALLFHQIFSNQIRSSSSNGQIGFSAREIALIMQAISNHDKYNMKLTSPVSAVVVLADKSDVHRSRTEIRPSKKSKMDIHDRVNYATTKSEIKVDKIKKNITLSLKIDVQIVPIMEYFEIFTERMIYCRKAADYLGYKFNLIINNFKLL